MRLPLGDAGRQRHHPSGRTRDGGGSPVRTLLITFVNALLLTSSAMGSPFSDVAELPCEKVLDETLRSYFARVPYPMPESGRLMATGVLPGALHCIRRSDREEVEVLMGTWRFSIGEAGEVLGWRRDLAGLWFTSNICSDVDMRGQLPLESEGGPGDSGFKRSVELLLPFPLSLDLSPVLGGAESRHTLAVAATYNELALLLTGEGVPLCSVHAAHVCDDFGALALDHWLSVRPWEGEVERRERLIASLLGRAEQAAGETGAPAEFIGEVPPRHPPQTTADAAAHALELLAAWQLRDPHNPWLLMEMALLHDLLGEGVAADDVLERLLMIPAGVAAEEIALAVRLLDRRPDVSEAVLERGLRVLRAAGYRPALDMDWLGLSMAVGVPCSVHPPSDDQLLLMAELYSLLAPASRNVANRIAGLTEYAEGEGTASLILALAAEHVTRHHPQGSREAQHISLFWAAAWFVAAFLMVLLLFYLVGLALARGVGFRIRNDDRRLVIVTLAVCVFLPLGLGGQIAERSAATVQADESARVLLMQQRLGLHPAIVGTCAGDDADAYSAWGDWLALDEEQQGLMRRAAPVLGDFGSGLGQLSAREQSHMDWKLYGDMLAELQTPLRQRSGPSFSWQRQSADGGSQAANVSLLIRPVSGHLPMWLAGLVGLFLGLVDAVIGWIWRLNIARARSRSNSSVEDRAPRPAAAPVSIWTTVPAFLGVALLSFVTAWDPWGQARMDRLFPDPPGMTWIRPGFALLEQVWVAMLGLALVLVVVGLSAIGIAIVKALRASSIEP